LDPPESAQINSLEFGRSGAAPRLHRLTGVEWAMRGELPWPDRLLGVTPRVAVVAGQ
jgi:hypothetical protein